MVGASVADYAIRKEVGEGGTSAVYLADHPNHGTVALKVLREKLRQDKTPDDGFGPQGQKRARGKNPNQVACIEVRGTGGTHFFPVAGGEGQMLGCVRKR